MAKSKTQLKALVKGARFGRQEEKALLDLIDSSATGAAQQSALTAADGSTVDATYGAEEAAVIANNVTRIGEIEAALQQFGIIA